MKSLRYIQIRPGEDFLNAAFISLTALERGVYLSIKMYLYANDGFCPFDIRQLKAITNCQEFEKIWPEVEKLFVCKNNEIRHKEVSDDLKKAKKFMQNKRKAGLASARARSTVLQQKSPGVATKERKRKEEERKGNTSSSTSSVLKIRSLSTSSRLDFAEASPLTKQLKFYDVTTELLKPRNRSDRSCIRNVAAWLKYQSEKQNDLAIFSRAWEYAQEAKANGKKPMAMFMSLMRDELGYRKLPNVHG